MDFVKLQMQLDQVGEDEDISPYEDEIEEEKPKRKRRKTAGDIDEIIEEEMDERETKNSKSRRRKTTGDTPFVPPQLESQQTITQMDWSFTEEDMQKEEDQLEEALTEVPQENEEGSTDFDYGVFDVPSSSQSFRRRSKESTIPKALGKSVKEEFPKSPDHSVGEMAPPQTPRRHFAQEIPSSESPATPASMNSRGSQILSQSSRSPLREKSTNVPPSSTLDRRPHTEPERLPKLVIKDTFEETQLSRIPSSPPKRSSPAKSVRFAIPDEESDEAPPTPSKTPARQSQTPKKVAPKISKLEILDSDAESDDDLLTEEPLRDTQIDEVPQPDTCYGELGEETQSEVERILSSPPFTRAIKQSQFLDEVDLDDIPTQDGLSSAPTSTQVFEETPLEEESEEPVDEGRTQYTERTQYIESQRLATQHITTMAPRTADSDIFVLIHPQQVANILERKKNHDMRSYPLPATVSRIWIYEPKPVTGLKYMAVISYAKRPGEIEDETGLGNADFNKKVGTNWHAYEILELYELADPLPLSKLVLNEWLLAPPKKYNRVPPAVLDSLMANLKPPVFTQHDDEENYPISSATDTQEVEAQLLSTTMQFTQLASSSQFMPDPTEHSESPSQEVVPSSQTDSPRQRRAFKTNLSQATTVDLSQTQRTPRKNTQHEIVWESPARPIPSSGFKRTPGSESSVQDSIVAIPSSQLRTQMLPESYVGESVPGPPLFIEDSDDEDD